MAKAMGIEVPDGRECPTCRRPTVLFRSEPVPANTGLTMLFYRCAACGGEWHTVEGLPVTSKSERHDA